jgi:hypothetical protein
MVAMNNPALLKSTSSWPWHMEWSGKLSRTYRKELIGLGVMDQNKWKVGQHWMHMMLAASKMMMILDSGVWYLLTSDPLMISDDNCNRHWWERPNEKYLRMLESCSPSFGVMLLVLKRAVLECRIVDDGTVTWWLTWSRQLLWRVQYGYGANSPKRRWLYWSWYHRSNAKSMIVRVTDDEKYSLETSTQPTKAILQWDYHDSRLNRESRIYGVDIWDHLATFGLCAT